MVNLDDRMEHGRREGDSHPFAVIENGRGGSLNHSNGAFNQASKACHQHLQSCRHRIWADHRLILPIRIARCFVALP
jgi:hypothetical protein